MILSMVVTSPQPWSHHMSTSSAIGHKSARVSGPRPEHSRKRAPHAAKKKSSEGNHRRCVHKLRNWLQNPQGRKLLDERREQLGKKIHDDKKGSIGRRDQIGGKSSSVCTRVTKSAAETVCCSERRPLVVTSNSYGPLFGQERF